MWAGACSTLLIGTDITDDHFVGSDAHTILTNKELLDTMSQVRTRVLAGRRWKCTQTIDKLGLSTQQSI
jgi:hypothetical protein